MPAFYAIHPISCTLYPMPYRAYLPMYPAFCALCPTMYPAFGALRPAFCALCPRAYALLSYIPSTNPILHACILRHKTYIVCPIPDVL